MIEISYPLGDDLEISKNHLSETVEKFSVYLTDYIEQDMADPKTRKDNIHKAADRFSDVIHSLQQIVCRTIYDNVGVPDFVDAMNSFRNDLQRNAYHIETATIKQRVKND